MKKLFILLLAMGMLACTSEHAIFNPNDSELVKFGLAQIQKQNPNLNIVFRLDSDLLQQQAYVIQPSSSMILISGGDERGMLYGALEVAEQLQLFGEVKNTSDAPYLLNRGLKMNIPLDARTPSYDDSGDAAQNNIIEMWSWKFWEEYLDKAALNRYNVLSFWNPHPFPSMIKLDKYPDIALDDVCKTTYVPKGYENEMGEPQLVASNVTDNLEVIKKMTIDEKIAFWQKVMQRATDRGIDIYWFTWNICPNSVAAPVKPGYKTFGINMESEPAGKYGITHAIDNPITMDYHRQAVKQFLLTYPNIKGIGVTAGEHMPKTWNGKNREEWLWETYGLGILDAKKEQPNRTIPFIHRVWHSNMEQIMKYWGQYPDPFEVSFKYAKARLYSSPAPQFHLDHIKQMKSYGLQSWWNLRNDDIFVYRWANSPYVRSYIRNLPLESTKGILMGSDGYVWGREFISKNPALAGELEFDKHWMKFMLWGRLAYNPDLDESVFQGQFQRRYNASNNALLYQTWQEISMVIPIVNAYHWRNWDADWQIEQCAARPKLGGFRDVFDFVDNPTMEGYQMLNPKQYVEKGTLQKNEIGPLNISEALFKTSDNCLARIRELRDGKENAATKTLMDDIEAMAHLGAYYAYKITAAVHIAQYQQHKDPKFKNEALQSIEKALTSAQKYAQVSKPNYLPQMTARAYIIDWDLFVSEVEKEVELVRELQ